MIILPLNEPVVMIAFFPANVVRINIIDKFVPSNRTLTNDVSRYCDTRILINVNKYRMKCLPAAMQ